MYTTQKNVQILIALLKEYNIRNIVISPGSRNMPLTHSVEQDPFFNCYSVIDERSAAYVAIGISIEKGEPTVLSCTSAQATRNYIPGMTEAYYRNTPLVVVTADYRPSMIGQGTMQAIDQTTYPSDTNKISVSLPLVKDVEEAAYCDRLINEALLELDHHGKGPVHINVPTEELWAGSVTQLPKVKKIDRYLPADDYPELHARRIMVAIGQHDIFSESETAAIEAFAEKYGAVIYTNHLSNYHGSHSIQGNLVLAGMDASVFSKYAPDLLITIGGQIGDYAFDGRIRQARFEHWRVAEDGKIVDTYNCLSRVFETTIVDFFTRYAAANHEVQCDDAYMLLWRNAKSSVAHDADLPLSHAYVAKKLAPMIPKRSNLHLAILSSLRNWNMFKIDSSVRCYSNVAAFGIDGCLSTFIGQSIVSDELNFLVIGDLSFFYDMNAVGIRHIKNNARIVLVNNGGGGEFRLFSHAANEFGDQSNRHIAAAGHNSSAKGWVESMGWRYVAVASKKELDKAAEKLVSPSSVPILMEVFTTMTDDSDGVQCMWNANSRKSVKGKLADKMSPKMKRAVKKITRR